MKALITCQLSKHRYIDNHGYLICTDCIMARTGKQTYTRDECFGDGDYTEIEVDRTPEEVFNPETLASFENAPITIEHPDQNVTPDNYNSLSVGTIRDVKKGTYNDQEVMVCTAVITDAEAIELVKSNALSNLSCGYECDVNDGDHPCQTHIRGNHVALCEIPRAGITRIQDSLKVNDMAMERGDAISNCIGTGKRFIKHFDKIYKEPNAESVNHWCNEMQTWFNNVIDIKLKENNKKLNNSKIRDWFFTAGAYPEDFIKATDEELDLYDDFCEDLLKTKNVKESIKLIHNKSTHDSLKKYIVIVERS